MLPHEGALQKSACERIAKLGPKAETLLSPITKQLEFEIGRHSGGHISFRLYAALAAIGRPTVPFLIRVIKGEVQFASNDTREDHKRHALRALAQMGAEAEDAIPTLETLASAWDYRMQQFVIEAAFRDWC